MVSKTTANVAWIRAVALLAGGCSSDGLSIPTPDLTTLPPGRDGADAGCSCLAVVPLGWTGPLVLSEGGPDNNAACAGDFSEASYVGYSGLVATPGDCTCTCGIPKDVLCYYTLLRVLTNNDVCTCAPKACFAINLQDWPPDKCVTNIIVEPPGTVQSISFDGALVVQGGSCAPSSPASPPATTWEKKALACGSRGVSPQSCGANAMCWGKKPDGFTGYCISHAGSMDCPAAFPEKHVYYAKVSDRRGCTPCTCGKPEQVNCTVKIEGYPTVQCGQPNLAVEIVAGKPLPGCVAGSDSKYFRQRAAFTGGGECKPSASSPTGTAAGDEATTFCCAR